jgi:hypothetical protein
MPGDYFSIFRCGMKEDVTVACWTAPALPTRAVMPVQCVEERRFEVRSTAEIGTDVLDAIKSAVRNKLAGMPVEECGITSDEDSTGDNAIFVDICYLRPTGSPIDPQIETELLAEVRDRLLNLGERRFPYIRHHLADGQTVKGW